MINYRKALLAFIPGIALVLVNYLYDQTYDPASDSYNYIGLLAFALAYLVFWSWESIVEKNFSQLKIFVVVFVIFYGISWLPVYFDPPKRSLWYINFLLNSWVVFAFTRGIVKKDWKHGLLGALIGAAFVSFHHASNSIQLYRWLEDYHEPWRMFLLLLCCYGYFFLLFASDTQPSLLIGFRRERLQKQIDKRSFLTGAFILYPVYLITYYSIFFSLGRASFVSSEYFADFLRSPIPYALGFLFFWSLYIYSNIIIRRLYTIKRPITWLYLLSFMPLINLIPLFIMANNKKAGEHVNKLSQRLPYYELEDKEDTRVYKIVIILLNIIGYLITYIMYFTDAVVFSSALVFMVTVGFLITNAVLLILFYYFRWVWVLLLLNLVVVSYLRLQYDLFDMGEFLKAVLLGLTALFVYYNSFHPIDLEVEKLYEKDNGPEINHEEV